MKSKTEGQIILGSLLVISLTQAPKRQQRSLWDGTGRHKRPFVPLRPKSPTTTTLLSILVLEIVFCLVVCVDLVDFTDTPPSSLSSA